MKIIYCAVLLVTFLLVSCEMKEDASQADTGVVTADASEDVRKDAAKDSATQAVDAANDTDATD